MKNESTNIATASYILFVGWGFAFCAREFCKDRDEYTAFHLRQSLGLHLLETAGYLLVNKLMCCTWLWQLLVLFFALCMIHGAYGAAIGAKRYQPFFGRFYERVLSAFIVGTPDEDEE